VDQTGSHGRDLALAAGPSIGRKGRFEIAVDPPVLIRPDLYPADATQSVEQNTSNKQRIAIGTDTINKTHCMNDRFLRVTQFRPVAGIGAGGEADFGEPFDALEAVVAGGDEADGEAVEAGKGLAVYAKGEESVLAEEVVEGEEGR